jgi:signal transduction histidine kinase
MNHVTRLAGRTDLVVNLMLGCGLAGILALEIRLSAGQPRVWSVGLPTSIALVALTLFRERNREWAVSAGLLICAVAAVVSVAADAPSQPGVATTTALLVLGASYLRVATPRRGGFVAAAGLVVLIAGRVDLRGSLVLPVAMLGILAWGSALGVGLWMRSLDHHRRAAIEAARRDERVELARELHDVVAHQIAGIVVQAQAARLVTVRQPDRLDALAAIESAGDEALVAMRRVVGLLRESDGGQGPPPGTEQLGELVRRFSAHGWPVEVQLPGADDGPETWTPEIRTTVYRVTQESLTNIIRHAQGTDAVRVLVHADPVAVRLEVTDSGAPAAIQPPWSARGYGLVGMRERVEALGGQFQAGTRPDGGWTVLATIPQRVRA